jgi:hypothetical protein
MKFTEAQLKQASISLQKEEETPQLQGGQIGGQISGQIHSERHR